MGNSEEALQQLISLSRHLAEPALDYVILAEGNTSARIDEETFWVKGSGLGMAGIEASGFAAMRFAPVLALLTGDPLSDEEIKAQLAAARVDPAAELRPSVETMLHAVALKMGEVRYVGHTHPTAVGALLCSRQAEEAVAGRLFPDEVVTCGPASVFVPYVDPGLPLAREVRQRMLTYVDTYGEMPKVVLMQNHGLVALGQSAAEVEVITAMAVKAARIRLGSYALGGLCPLSAEAVSRIRTRPDELYRRQLLNRGQG